MWFVNKILIIFFMTTTSVYSKGTKEDTTTTCFTPELIVKGNQEATEGNIIKDTFSNVKEVKFFGSIGPLGEKRLCKIKCIGGQWVGPLCIDEQVSEKGRFQPLFRNCKLEYFNPNLLVTFRNITIRSIGLEYPHGSILKIRCRDVGLYKLLGASTPKCENGVWSSRLPSCVPTTLFTNFTEDAPPTILFKIPSGSSSIESGGELAIYPGTTVHLECIFSRHLGSPDWTWTAPLGEYLTGWAIAPEERDWKYRLSIYYAKEQDSGTFTCATPRGITNSIVLQVAAVNCEPVIELDSQMTMRAEGGKLGQKVYFQCQSGYQIKGEHNLTCQISGRWSATVPSCELVKCPLFESNGNLTALHLKIEEQNNSYGGRIVFSCDWGYRLIGLPGIECELNGSWSGYPPKCAIIQCSPPIIQETNNLLVTEVSGMDGGKYTVGSLLQFSCADLHSLSGESTIICTENGVWSHPLPICQKN